MSVEIALKQHILVTDFHLLKSLPVVLGFGSQVFVCGFRRQNINSVQMILSPCIFQIQHPLIKLQKGRPIFQQHFRLNITHITPITFQKTRSFLLLSRFGSSTVNYTNFSKSFHDSSPNQNLVDPDLKSFAFKADLESQT